MTSTDAFGQVYASATPAQSVNDWSHSTVFTTSLSTYQSQNVPALTSLWTAPSGCSARWMHEEYIVYEHPSITFVAFSSAPLHTDNTAILYDMKWASCQPYGSRYHYSPGVCPHGHTVAEITEYHVQTIISEHTTVSAEIETHFQASCCRSGMTFGSERDNACISSIFEPFEIYGTYTLLTSSRASPSTGSSEVVSTKTLSGYEFTDRIWLSSGFGNDGFLTRSLSNITTATAGFIAHDPYVIGWNQKDLSQFPTDYVSSLASRYNTMWLSDNTGTPTPGGTSKVAAETNKSASEMSTGTRAGIGVGVSLGVILLLGIGSLLLFTRRRRKKARKEAKTYEHGISEMEDRDEVHSRRTWYLFGKWRNEISTANQKLEIDSTTVHEVASPIAELHALPAELYAPPAELETIEKPREFDTDGDDEDQPVRHRVQ